jgi:uncharacterized membrane protein
MTASVMKWTVFVTGSTHAAKRLSITHRQPSCRHQSGGLMMILSKAKAVALAGVLAVGLTPSAVVAKDAPATLATCAKSYGVVALTDGDTQGGPSSTWRARARCWAR